MENAKIQGGHARFGTGAAILFCLISLLGAGLTVLTGEYSMGLLLLSVAGGFGALPFYCGRGKALLAGGTGLLAVLFSFLLYPARPWFGVFVLSFCLLGGAIALSARLGCSRTGYTAAGAGAFALCLTAGFLLYLAIRFGGIGLSAFTAFREAVEAQLTAALQAFYEINRLSLEELAAAGGSSAAAATELLKMIPGDAVIKETVSLMVELFSVLLPGFVLGLSCCLSHLAVSIFLRFSAYYGEYVPTKEEKRILIALPGAALFYFGAIMTVFGGDGVISITGMNFFLLYLPGFVLMGVKEVFKKENLKRRGGFVLPVILAASFLLSPMLLPLLLALFGASASVQTAIRRRIAEKMNGENKK